ncbi:MAG: AraC family transcriptional regulator [Sphingobacteriales bacterium]|nr:MAG: AraC family transcriptional regulator [Sphingobacteriales bacterium]
MYFIYYQYHIVKLKAVIHFVENEEVEIESFYLIENNSSIKRDDLPEIIGNASNIEKLFNEIKIHMIKKKPWINPEYTLEQLARDVNSNTQYVSAAINIYTKNNFKTYINEFRVQAFINTVGDIKSKKTSIKEVYLNVGFNSQSTFNRVFKQSQNISPTDFVQNHLLNS